MELSHTGLNLHSAAAERLNEYIARRRERFGEETHNFEGFEQELHTLIMAVERELVQKRMPHIFSKAHSGLD
jgi:hypothetical protein